MNPDARKESARRLWIETLVILVLILASTIALLYLTTSENAEKMQRESLAQMYDQDYRQLLSEVLDGTIGYTQSHGGFVVMKETLFTTEELMTLREKIWNDLNYCLDEQIYEFTFIPGNEKYQQRMKLLKNVFRYRCQP